MKGFFSKKDTKSATRPDKNSYSCASCGLYEYVLSPRMESYGKGEKRILNIGEAPGEKEDKLGKPWQGKMGRFLQKTYRDLGFSLFEDCKNVNAINCRPTDKSGNRPPSNHEIKCCRSRVLRVIKKFNPHVIILLGNAPLTSLFDYRVNNRNGGITKWRGWQIPDKDFDAWICPVFHPSYVERRHEDHVETIWKKDLKNAFEKVDEPLPDYNINEDRIKIIDDLSVLYDIEDDMVAFDYETTGIKPHDKGHRIISASVASENNVYSFLMPDTKKERKPFLDLLANPDIGKIAHNMKYEDAWSKVRLRQPVNNWAWDSMLAAHVLDNRRGVTGLKFQALVNFGIMDYSSDVDSYLKSNSKNGNAKNKINKLIERHGPRDLLIYGGMDSLIEYKLARRQMKELDMEGGYFD